MLRERCLNALLFIEGRGGCHLLPRLRKLKRESAESGQGDLAGEIKIFHSACLPSFLPPSRSAS